MLKLISATPSPWARKVRIILHEKNVEFELLNDIPWSAETCVPEHNPLEKLPILLTEQGAIYESRLIVEWIERRFPDPRMIPEDDRLYIAAKTLEVLADGTLDALLLFNMERSRPHPTAAWAERQLRKILGGFGEVARRIADQRYALLDRFTLADAAIGSMLGAFDMTIQLGRFSELDWRRDYPDLATYFDGLQQRESFRRTIPVMFDFEPAKAIHAA